MQIKKDDLVLVVGLGNETSTPDALGPLLVKNNCYQSFIFSWWFR